MLFSIEERFETDVTCPVGVDGWMLLTESRREMRKSSEFPNCCQLNSILSFALTFSSSFRLTMNSCTRSASRNRLRKATAIRFAPEIRASARRIEARGQLDFPQSVFMAIMFFYLERFGERNVPIKDMEVIYEYVMNLHEEAAREILAAFLDNNGEDLEGAGAA